MISLADVIQHLRPDVQMPDQCLIEDDGTGPRVVAWTSQEPQPTQAEIEAAYPAAQAAAQRAAIPSVSIRQMHIALHRLGLLTPIKEYIAASGDIELEIAFASPTFERSNALIGDMAQAMGKTDAEVDAIFALAASI